MQQFELDYAELIKDILQNGTERQTRNAVTKSVFGRMLKFQMPENHFPILQGRKMFYKGVVGELAALLKGPKSLKDFEDQGCNYWRQWAKPDGSIEIDYGNAWLDFNGVNQLDELVKGLRDNPFGRRHIITGWRPDRLPELSLPCCHLLYQWYVREEDGKNYLDMIWYQRSVDTMIGLPSDIILAYVWNILIANNTGYLPGEINMMLGDTHIYEPHYKKAEDYLKNVHHMNCMTRPDPIHDPIDSGIDDFKPLDVMVHGYAPMPKIDFELLA